MEYLAHQITIDGENTNRALMGQVGEMNAANPFRIERSADSDVSPFEIPARLRCIPGIATVRIGIDNHIQFLFFHHGIGILGIFGNHVLIPVGFQRRQTAERRTVIERRYGNIIQL